MNLISLYQLNNKLLLICSAMVGALAIVSFDNPVIFNISFVALLLIVGLVNFDNKNVVSLFLILVVDRAVGQVAGQLPDANLFGKLAIYAFVISIIVILRYQTLSKWVLVSLAIVIPVEIYWYTVSYEAPAIYFYYIGMMQIIALRYFLLMRMGFFRRWKNIEPQNMDYNLSELFQLSGFLNLAMLAEYLLRHLLSIDIMWVYESYEYVQHGLSALAMMVILFHTVSHPFHTTSRSGVLRV
jgi:hypothetical protein